jgi:heterotetrameric sarcosine oxidase gamma subunit
LADTKQSLERIESPGITVVSDAAMTVASLRYFVADGGFAAAVRRHLGVDLPIDPNSIAIADRPTTLLAWRRPGECLLISPEFGLADELVTTSGGLSDGRAINLTDGTCVLRIGGHRSAELLSRMSCHGSIPLADSARATRVAELPVVLIRALSDEVLLLIDRLYVEHLMQWIRASIADFAVHSDSPSN